MREATWYLEKTPGGEDPPQGGTQGECRGLKQVDLHTQGHRAGLAWEVEGPRLPLPIPKPVRDLGGLMSPSSWGTGCDVSADWLCTDWRRTAPSGSSSQQPRLPAHWK